MVFKDGKKSLNLIFTEKLLQYLEHLITSAKQK